jgi:uncharacterized protein YqeY
MAFIDKISQDLTAAMRAKDQLRLGTLRMTKAALMNREVEKKRALDDAESQQVVAGMIKQRRDSIEQFRSGGRPELADKEQAEIAILEAYLPPPMDAAELEGHVAEGHGACDERRDGAPGGARRGRQDRERSGEEEARRRLNKNGKPLRRSLRLITLKGTHSLSSILHRAPVARQEPSFLPTRLGFATTTVRSLRKRTVM